ncbi:1,3-beta-glucanosyltransferase [Terramyces sp. JEL0728]|nr:1,3-beta-glucanosyltransferase [Terramyces sp. JEL0728]
MQLIPVLLVLLVNAKYFIPTKETNLTPSLRVPFNMKVQSKDVAGQIFADSLASTLVGTVGIGNPAQYFLILFDTGSSLFWVRSSNCTTAECKNQRSFNPVKSSSFKGSSASNSVSVTYGDGTAVSCVIQQDQLQLGSKFITKQNVCLANSITTSTASTDGIIGIGPPNGKLSGADVFATLQSQNQSAIISLWYNRTQSNGDGGDAGEISIGGINGNHVKDKISWIPLSSNRQHWYISLNSMGFDDGTMIYSAPLDVIIDSGTTVVLLPQSKFNILNSKMGAKLNNGLYYVDCSRAKQLPDISFSFGTFNTVLSWDQQLLVDLTANTCMSIFQPTTSSLATIGPIFGALFLKQFVSAFDYDNSRFGLSDPKDSVLIQLPQQSSAPAFSKHLLLLLFMCLVT